MNQTIVRTVITLLFSGCSALVFAQDGRGEKDQKKEFNSELSSCLTKDELTFAEKSERYRVSGRNCLWSKYSDSTATLTYRESPNSSTVEGRLQIGNKLYDVRGELQEGLGIYRATLWFGNLKGIIYWEPKPAPEHNHEEECEECYSDTMIVQVNLCNKKILLELSN